MIISLPLVAFGLIGLWISGELVVRYSLQLAYLSGISTLFIGFFFISISTGLPELFVVFNATWLKTPALAVGDIMGSNFFDLAMGMGIPAFFIRPILVQKNEFARTIYMLISTILLILFIFAHQQLQFWHGITLILMYAAINIFSFTLRGKNNTHNDSMPLAQKTLAKELFLKSIWGTAFKLFCSIMLVLLAAHITVTYAIQLAHTLGFPITHFGATFIALGTSLPELTLGLTAAKNKEYALALGNAFGSIWDQGGLMLGLLIILNKHPINITAIWHLLPFALVAFAIISFAIVKHKRINKTAGILLICTYSAFVLYEIIGL
jgi:cation:H+ antiporter